MPRAFTAQERQIALLKIELNLGDIPKTSRELGIPERTLQSWRKKYIPPTDVEQLRQLRQRLIAESLELASHIKQVIEEAPLNQRAAALNQMIDKILKITEVLEEGEGVKEKTEVVVIEYGDDGDEDQIQEDVSESEADFE